MLHVPEKVESIAAQTPPIDSKVLGAGFPKRSLMRTVLTSFMQSEAKLGAGIPQSVRTRMRR